VEKLNRAVSSSIRMGEMSVAADGEELRTLVGSCIGLALHDRRRKVGGLAHIVLPKARGKTDRPGKFVDTAIPALIERMESLSGCKLKLTAKMAGGASMFTTTVAANIGRQNIESCEQLLGDLGIPIVARHCGGEQGRRMAIDTANGKVVIEIVGLDPIEL
jgi:chemotaxis protein CheD